MIPIKPQYPCNESVLQLPGCCKLLADQSDFLVIENVLLTTEKGMLVSEGATMDSKNHQDNHTASKWRVTSHPGRATYLQFFPTTWGWWVWHAGCLGWANRTHAMALSPWASSLLKTQATCKQQHNSPAISKGQASCLCRLPLWSYN